jgi:predicted permease
MRSLRRLLARAVNFMTRRRADQRLREEMEEHLALQTEENLRAGMPPAEARREALLKFGSVEAITEDYHAEHGLPFVETLFQDLRFGIRMLRRSPGLTCFAVLALGLGLGVNAAIFTVADWFLFRPLAVRNPADLAYLAIQRKGEKEWSNGLSWLDLNDIRAQTSSVFIDVAGALSSNDGLTVDGVTEPMAADYVTGNFFETMGVKPGLGRPLKPSRGEILGRDPVLVLSHLYWKTRFQADSQIIGKTALVNGHPVTIVGVAPEGFHGTDAWTDVQGYLPLGMSTASNSNLLSSQTAQNLLLIARLKPGVHLSNTKPVLDVVANRLASQSAEPERGISLRAFKLTSSGPSGDPEGSPLPKVAGILLMLAALVLLLACANVAGLLIVRGAGRAREVAIRHALGAKRTRIVRQLVLESLPLVIMGCAAGAFLSWIATAALRTIHLAPSLPLVVDSRVDWRVFAYEAGAALLTSALIGIVPALRTSRRDVMESIHMGGHALVGTRQRLRSVTVITQVAISTVLLVVAVLFARSLVSISRVDLGFDSHNVLNLTMDPHLIGYGEAQSAAFYRELLGRVRGLPEIESASLAALVPMGDEADGDDVDVPGLEIADGSKPHGRFNVVSADYFRTMRIPILRGRDFAAADTQHSPFVAIVNETMAKRSWPDRDAIGQVFTLQSDPKQAITVVGIAGNSRNYDFAGPFDSYFYLPLSQHFRSEETLEVRTKLARGDAVHDITNIIHSSVQGMPIFDVQTMTNALDQVNGMLLPQLGAVLTASFGLLGLTLALIGLYGVVSYTASQRTREIGLRMALGAQREAIIRLILHHSFVLVMIGLGIGVVFAFGLTRLVGDFLVGVRPSDPLTYAGVSFLLTSVTLCATYFPARRATVVDPTVALHEE